MTPPPDATPHLQPGDTLGRFRVVSLLGVGSTAAVYAVRHRALGTEHAVKLLHSRDASLRDRLLQEARMQAQLVHPHIVAVSDVIEHEGYPGLVLQLIAGTTLERRLAEGGPLPRAEALRLFHQLLDAVEVAHAAGVLHRDLKPGNVLLREEDGAAMITDFGIAKALTRSTRTGQTRAGTAMGTPGYMAPEQWADATAVDARADLFALGAILYEMLAGKAPFAGPDMVSVMRATLDGAAPPIPGLSPPLAAALHKALRPDPAERFASCAEFRAALQAKGPVPTPAAPKAPRKGPLVAAMVVGGLGLGLLGLLGAAGLFLFTQESAPVVAAPPIPEAPTPAPPDPETEAPPPRAVEVPGGAFTLASGRTATLSTFWIDRTERTQGDWSACVEAGRCGRLSVSDDTPEGPARGMSWEQARAHCAWSGGRLPSELEWEKAAAWDPVAGVRRDWPWGSAPPDCSRVHAHGCEPAGPLHPDGLPEGASAVGAVQLLGNLWEWTSTLQEKGRKKGLLRKATPDRYVLRGGSWDSEAPTLRARWVADADTQAANVGLRCVFREAPAP